MIFLSRILSPLLPLIHQVNKADLRAMAMDLLNAYISIYKNCHKVKLMYSHNNQQSESSTAHRISDLVYFEWQHGGGIDNLVTRNQKCNPRLRIQLSLNKS